MKRKKILVVGQTPPPYHGQAVMIEKILQGEYDNVKLYHVRMHFSTEINQIGRFRISKLFHLIRVIINIYFYRFVYGPKIIYYPPSGPVINAVARDMFILFSTRWLFKRTIFQFFAGGISEIYSDLQPIVKFFFRKSFFAPDVAIRPADYGPDDVTLLQAKRVYTINWATHENYARFADEYNDRNKQNILFVGALKESKGIFVLLEACTLLLAKGIEFKVSVVGESESSTTQKRLDMFIKKHKLADKVIFQGVQTGDDYYRHYIKASIFCFPTYYESENVPIVAIDASEFELPVISTWWRGVPSVVEDGVTGFLVPIKDALAIANKIEDLLIDAELCAKMGKAARKAYLTHFNIHTFYKNMGEVFSKV